MVFHWNLRCLNIALGYNSSFSFCRLIETNIKQVLQFFYHLLLFACVCVNILVILKE